VPAYSYVVAATPIGASRQLIGGLLPSAAGFEPASWLDPVTGIPYQLAFGFSASTGGSTDIHEISNVALSPLNTNPPRFGLGLIDSAAGHLVQGSSVTYLASPSVSASGGSEGQVPSFTTTFPQD